MLRKMLHIQTAVVNNPKFIELQHTTCKFFVSGDYDFTVFNDAKDWPDYSNFGNPELRRDIQRTCERLNIPCISLNHPHHRSMACAANRCANANNAMLEVQRATADSYLVLDSDMFPIAPMGVDKYNAFDGAIVRQRVEKDGRALDYFWNGIYYFNMAKLAPKALMDWKCDMNDGVWTDVGGGMYTFLRETKNKLYSIPHLISLRWGVEQYPLMLDLKWLNYIQSDSRNVGRTFFSEIYDDTFLHFRAGGNWEQRDAGEYASRVKLLESVVLSVCHG